MLPARHQYAGRALRLLDEQWALRTRVTDDPIGALAGPAPPAMATAADLGRLLAERIEEMLRAAGGKGARQRNARHRAQMASTPERVAQYFQHDQLPPDEDDALRLNDVDPTTLPLFQRIAEPARLHFEGRHETLGNVAPNAPRRPAVQPLARAYFTYFMLPPDDTERRCKRDQECVVLTMDPTKGYRAREFHLPDQPPKPDDPLGYCRDCLLIHWNELRRERLRNDSVGPPIETFSVTVGEGEYDEHAVSHVTLDHRPTGLLHHLPTFSRSKREYLEIPRHLQHEAGNTSKGYYFAEVGQDFHPASIDATDA